MELHIFLTAAFSEIQSFSAMWQTHGSSCEFLCKVTFPGDVQIKHAPRKKKRKKSLWQLSRWFGHVNKTKKTYEDAATISPVVDKHLQRCLSPMLNSRRGGGGVKAGGAPEMSNELIKPLSSGRNSICTTSCIYRPCRRLLPAAAGQEDDGEWGRKEGGEGGVRRAADWR